MPSLLALLALSAPALAGGVPAEEAARLERLVVQDCGSCHGMRLTGGLGTPLTPDALAHAAPEGLAAIILDGLPGTAMPAWRSLVTEAEAMWIADYLLKGGAE